MARSFIQNLAIYQGDDWAAMVSVLNSDGSIPDLTGYTAQAQIRQGPADQSWVIQAELLCVVVPLNQISLSLTSAQTTLLTEPQYQWDLQLTAPDGLITTIMAGQVQVAAEVTREGWGWDDDLALVWVRDPRFREMYWTDVREP